MIVMKNICKTYSIGENEVAALQNVDLHVKAQEFVSLLGPSGSGKSTLMNIIGCLDIADSGEYYLEGEAIEDLSEDELSAIRSRKIGFVFQAFNLLNDLTAYENVEMPLLYQKLSASQRRLAVEKAMEQVGLSKRLHHKPSQLSGGEQQRVAIARALASNPSLILADEPTGNLDSVSGKEIINLLKDLWNKGNTVVLITHDINIANEAQRKVYLHDGHLSDRETVV